MAPSRSRGSRRSRPSGVRWKHLPAVITALALPWAAPVAAADKSAGDYFVHSLPGAPDGPLVKMHAG